MSDHKVASTLNEAITLFSHTTVVGVLYTFNLILYYLCARLSFSWLRALDGKRRTALTLILASVIIICGTFHVALKNQYARLTYVDYSSLPGGPIGNPAQSHAATLLQILNLAAVIAEILTLGVLLWRVWVVYTGTRFAVHVIVLASLFYLAYTVSNILQLAFIWAPLSSAFQTITRTLDIVVVLTLAFSAASKIMMTLLIILRLLFIRQKHIKLLGNTDIAAQYLSIAAMLIESYALSTAWNIGYLIAYILKNPPAHNFFENSLAQVEILSYFLVLYRVFSGRAWNRQTQNQLSTVIWGRRGNQLTDDEPSMGAVSFHAGNLPAIPSALSSRANF
ncbi:hypothetical protein AGABI2DRAFT_123117 [Agaricus bisporus var. bisporus H97]|nr:hypothetical protein AGABI2DRAFT_123117 [Agaricus bisporus var. bisporus H97]EKV41997.1 hypothetical protein AGABI2DRAFT_123117 [Agaricus bisporus var. bisporus H97]